MKPLRVLYLIDGLGAGGAQRQLVTLVRSAPRGTIRPEVAFYRDRTHFVRELRDGGVPVHVLGTRGGRDPRTLVRLARLIRSGPYDLIHTYLSRPGILARLATPFGGPPVVLSERSVSLGKTAWVRWSESLLASRAAAMIVNAEAIRLHVEQAVPAWRGRITVVPNGVATAEPAEDDLAEARRFRERHLAGRADLLFVSVARLADAKDPHMLLSALAALPANVRDRATFVWVGACRDRAYGDEVRRRTAELGLDGTIVFLDPVRDVRPLYLAADAVVLTSAWEGFPNAVLEAFASARPVVATSVGDVPALVRDGETGLLARPGDAEGFARRLVELSGMTAEERALMGARGFELARREYSTERLVERTLDVYRRVLSASSA